MRLLWKFAAILIVTVGLQRLLEAHIGDLDEAQFAAQVYLAHLRGAVPSDPELITAAERLSERQIARWDRWNSEQWARLGKEQAWPATRCAHEARVGDEWDSRDWCARRVVPPPASATLSALAAGDPLEAHP